MLESNMDDLDLKMTSSIDTTESTFNKEIFEINSKLDTLLSRVEGNEANIDDL